MRGAPHKGFAVAMSTIKVRASGGRRARLRPEHGLGLHTRADRQDRQTLVSSTQNSRSRAQNRGRRCAAAAAIAAGGPGFRARDLYVRRASGERAYEQQHHFQLRSDCGVCGSANQPRGTRTEFWRRTGIRVLSKLGSSRQDDDDERHFGQPQRFQGNWFLPATGARSA